MSRTEHLNFRASDAPSLRAPSLRALRAGLGLTLVVSLLAFALRVHTHQTSAPAGEPRPSIVQAATR